MAGLVAVEHRRDLADALLAALINEVMRVAVTPSFTAGGRETPTVNDGW